MKLHVSQEVREMADAVYAMTADLERGDVLTHGAVASVVGWPAHSPQWESVVRLVRRMLRVERGIACWPNFEGGYKLCTVDQQLKLVAERTKRARRQYGRGRVAVESLPPWELNDHQANLRAALAVAAHEAERRAAADARRLRLMCRPANPLGVARGEE